MLQDGCVILACDPVTEAIVVATRRNAPSRAAADLVQLIGLDVAVVFVAVVAGCHTVLALNAGV